MVKALAIAVMATMTLGMGVAIGSETVDRTVAPATMRVEAKPRAQIIASQRQNVERLMVRARGCKTLQCINKSFKALFRVTSALWHLVWECERVAAVTQYSGYAYGTESTTALDYTAQGDPATDWVVVDVCQ